MRLLLTLSFAALCFLAIKFLPSGKFHAHRSSLSTHRPPSPLTPNPSFLKKRLDSVAQRSKLQLPPGYSDTVFLIDMRLPSGSARFFVYDLPADSSLAAGLVAHGSGSDDGSGKLTFSDKPGSLATSLGRYRIGENYIGKFGSAYKLDGLDQTNTHARARAVVLHAHECVPDAPVYPEHICLSWGCPTVSPGFLTTLEGYFSRGLGKKLLYVYY